MRAGETSTVRVQTDPPLLVEFSVSRDGLYRVTGNSLSLVDE